MVAEAALFLTQNPFTNCCNLQYDVVVVVVVVVADYNDGSDEKMRSDETR